MVAAELNQQLMREHFSRQAEEYDRYAVVQARVVSRLAELFVGASPVSGTILDVGTGTGRLSRTLAGRFPQLRPVLSDIAHGMTLHAARELPGTPAVDADASTLPFASCCFNQVVSASVYQWLEDLDQAFAEVARVLAPGGGFVFALFGERSLYELRSSHRQALAELHPERSSHVQEFPDEGGVTQALQAAGLQPLELFSEQELEFHPSVSGLLRSLKKIGAGNASSQRPPGLASRQVMQRMMAIYEQQHASQNGIPATYQVIYAVAKKPV